MKEYGVVLENVSLRDFNTYKIGGIARYIVKPNSFENLIKLIGYLDEENIKYIVLGKGSNVILPDEDFEGVIILLDYLNKVNIIGNIVEAEVGISLSAFIMSIINNELGGLENLCGIPGTLGGSIVGNAGCYGSQISDYLVDVTYLENGIVKTIAKEECKFSYRDSIFKRDKNKIILSCKFRLVKSNKDIMLESVKEHALKRKNRQPLEYPNAGSVFRNPVNLSSGKLIDEAGLKGYSVGDAEVSTKHAGFIINKGKAKAKDVLELVEHIKKQVKEKFNEEIELEILVIGKEKK